MGLNVGWDGNTGTVLLTTGGTPVNADGKDLQDTEPRSLSATLNYNDIKITLDGKNVIPVDGNGQPVEPFIISGTTYLPVRGVASVLGLQVDWDGNSNTVILNTKSSSSQTLVNTNGVPDGWLPYGTSNIAILLKAALKGHVIYRNGQYWCSPEYASTVGNENIVSIVDVSDKIDRLPQIDLINLGEDDLWYTIEVGLRSTREKLKRQKTADAIRDALVSGNANTGSFNVDVEVTDLEVLQSCLPSIPDDFMVNPVAGTYDGVRIIIDGDGTILLNCADLADKGLN